ncbi:MAG: metallophosphoesterase family protein, partial [Candidatus Omnitrophica bacterium]|nr:metallophosphoesterase family protein [Candidatus Omnitrophota bacterium]
MSSLMRYGIFSDIHSNLEALEAVIAAYKKESIGSYLCIGDLVGYAANPNECAEKVKSLACVSVAGNHDLATLDSFSVEYFNAAAAQAIFWTRSKIDENSRLFLESLKLVYKNEDLILTHGTLNQPQDFNYLTDSFMAEESFRLMEGEICFVGHTHVAGIFTYDKDGYTHYSGSDYSQIKEGNKYIVNVGSVGQPRDGNPKAAYCIYDSL